MDLCKSPSQLSPVQHFHKELIGKQDKQQN